MLRNNLKRMRSKPIEIVAILHMGDSNSYFHLKPIAMSENVSLLRIVRPMPPITRDHIEKSRYSQIEGNLIIQRLWRVYRKAVTLTKDHDVKAFVSFFAFPYGLIALIAGFRTGTPVHIGFVGSDWHRDCQSWFGPLLNYFLRKATFITVPGKNFKTELIKKKYPAEKIHVLPHAIDVEKYTNPPAEDREFDCIFVGYLRAIKRVDLIISAISRVRKKYPDIKVCIVGDGKQRKNLKKQVSKLGLNNTVVFVGWQSRTYEWYCKARMVLLTSKHEGLPFSLIEGMVSGAVPIATKVGAIPSIIDHKKTGLIINPGDINELVASIIYLLENKSEYERIRNAVVKTRDGFRFENIAHKWSNWIEVYGF